MDEARSTHQMVENLHSRFTGLNENLNRLHGDHKELRADVEVLRESLREIEARVDKHEGIAEQQLNHIREAFARLEKKFDQHTEREDSDRQWLFRLLVLTFLSAAGGFVTIVMRLGGLGG